MFQHNSMHRSLRFEALETRTMLNGNPLLELPHMTSGDPDDTVCTSSQNPGYSNPNNQNNEGNSPTPKNPFAAEAFKKAIEEFLQQQHEQETCTDPNCQHHPGTNPTETEPNNNEPQPNVPLPDDISSIIHELRRLQDLQITIETRFITLDDSFFERIGVDFDFNPKTPTPPNPPETLPPPKTMFDNHLKSIVEPEEKEELENNQSQIPQLDKLPAINNLFSSEINKSTLPNFPNKYHSNAQLPKFIFTTVSTTVSIPDGGIILLGGIKRLREGRPEVGIPMLGKLPYINRLFKNVSVGHETADLMILVTPRIIIQDE